MKAKFFLFEKLEDMEIELNDYLEQLENYTLEYTQINPIAYTTIDEETGLPLTKVVFFVALWLKPKKEEEKQEEIKVKDVENAKIGKLEQKAYATNGVKIDGKWYTLIPKIQKIIKLLKINSQVRYKVTDNGKYVYYIEHVDGGKNKNDGQTQSGTKQN